MSSSNGIKRLIINADDFGWSRGISDGIFLAHRHGLVTSASLMVNQPASEYALVLASQNPRLTVGVHLNLSAGAPVLPPENVPTLVDREGKFYPFVQLHRRLLRWQVSSAEVEAEFRAQVRWMKQRGFTPTHADSHHGVHIYPAAALAFRRALLHEGIRRARGHRLRHWLAKGVSGLPYTGPAPRRWLVWAYVELLHALVFRELVSVKSGLVVHPSFRWKLDRLREAWRHAFANLAPGTYELGCHPGFSEPGFSETDPIRELRERELEALTHRDLRHDLHRSGVELITYADL